MSDNKDFETSLKYAMQEIIDSTEVKLLRACMYVEGKAKEDCPLDEGHLRASITSQTVIEKGNLVGLVGSNLEYAPYVHEGTGIYARNGKGRKTPWMFKSDSKKWKGWHKTRGQKPKPFLEDAMHSSLEAIERILGG